MVHFVDKLAAASNNNEFSVAIKLLNLGIKETELLFGLLITCPIVPSMMKLMDKYLNINLFKLGQKLIVILFH